MQRSIKIQRIAISSIACKAEYNRCIPVCDISYIHYKDCDLTDNTQLTQLELSTDCRFFVNLLPAKSAHQKQPSCHHCQSITHTFSPERSFHPSKPRPLLY